MNIVQILVYIFDWIQTYSFYIQFFMKLVIFFVFNKVTIISYSLRHTNHKFGILKKVCKFLILFGLVYQLIDLTEDYLNYNYVIELIMKNMNNETLNRRPGYTLCMNNSQHDEEAHQFYLEDLEFNKEKIINELNRRNMTDKINTTLRVLYKQWRLKAVIYHFRNIDLSKLVVHYRLIKDGFCLTFNPGQTDIKVFYSYFYYRLQLTIHQPHNPSHFNIKNQFHIKQAALCKTLIKLTKIDYLPYPFETDCIEYSKKQINEFWRKSQTDCKLKVMRIKELKTCGHNYYWNEMLLDNDRFVLDQIKESTNETLLKNCSVNVEERYLDKLCKTECNSQFYETSLIMGQNVEEEKRTKLVYIEDISLLFKHIIHSPAMNINSYLSAFGGNISMWLGLCVIDIFLLLCKIFTVLTKIIILKLNRLKYLKIIRVIRMNLLINILCTLLLAYQLRELINDFNQNNENTVVNFRKQPTFPNFNLFIYEGIGF